MSEIENPNAFPICHIENGSTTATWPGMSLRDWFAGQVIGTVATSGIIGSDARATAQGMAEDAYTIADAMLAARGDHP